MAAHHGRDQWQKLTLAATKDGTVTGLKVDLLADLGAYVALVGGGVPVLGAFMFNAIYKFPAYQFNCQTVLHQQDLDRRLPRRRPAGGDVRASSGSWTSSPPSSASTRSRSGRRTGSSTRSSRSPRSPGWSTTPATTRRPPRRAKEIFGYDELRAEQKQRRESNDPVQLGIGVSTFTEMCGLAPSRVLGSLDYGAGGWEHASVRMLPTGKVEVVTGIVRARPGPRDRVVADRRRPARRAVRGRRGAARRHPGRRTRAWTPTARARWSSAARRWSGPPTR